MRRNRSLGIVDAGIEPEIAAEAIVAAVERLVVRYMVTGERPSRRRRYGSMRCFHISLC